MPSWAARRQIRRRRDSRQECSGTSRGLRRQQLRVPLEALVAVGQVLRQFQAVQLRQRISPDQGRQGLVGQMPVRAKAFHRLHSFPMPAGAAACPGAAVYGRSLPAGPAPGPPPPAFAPPAGTGGTPAGRALSYGRIRSPELLRRGPAEGRLLRGRRLPGRDAILPRQQGVALVGALQVVLGLVGGHPAQPLPLVSRRDGGRGGGRRRGRTPGSGPPPRRRPAPAGSRPCRPAAHTAPPVRKTSHSCCIPRRAATSFCRPTPILRWGGLVFFNCWEIFLKNRLPL